MITRTDLSFLRVLDFFQVLTNISTHIAHYTLAQPKLAARAAALSQAVAELDTALKPLRASAATEKLNAQDHRRDLAITGLAAQIRSFAKHFDAATRDAAKQLKITLEKYGKAPQELPLREETAMATQFLQDMQKPENAAALAKIHAESWTAELADANSVFEALYNARSEEGAKVELGAVKSARIKAQKAFDDFAKGLNAHAELNDATEYKALEDEINYEVRQAKASQRPGNGGGDKPQA